MRGWRGRRRLVHFQARQRFIDLFKFALDCDEAFDFALLPADEELLLALMEASQHHAWELPADLLRNKAVSRFCVPFAWAGSRSICR